MAKVSSCMLSENSSPMICSLVSVICDELSVRDLFEPLPLPLWNLLFSAERSDATIFDLALLHLGMMSWHFAHQAVRGWSEVRPRDPTMILLNTWLGLGIQFDCSFAICSCLGRLAVGDAAELLPAHQCPSSFRDTLSVVLSISLNIGCYPTQLCHGQRSIRPCPLLTFHPTIKRLRTAKLLSFLPAHQSGSYFA